MFLILHLSLVILQCFCRGERLTTKERTGSNEICERETGTQRLTNWTLEARERLTRCADQNASPNSDKGGV